MKKRLAEKVFGNIMTGRLGYRSSTLERAFSNRNARRDRKEEARPDLRQLFNEAMAAAARSPMIRICPTAEFMEIGGHSISAEDIENLKLVAFGPGGPILRQP